MNLHNVDYRRGYYDGMSFREEVENRKNSAFCGHLINAAIVACALASFFAAGPSWVVILAILCAIGAWTLAHLASGWAERYAGAYRVAYLLAAALTAWGVVFALMALTRG